MSNPTQRYIGIDDTDNLETRGTGYRARQLIELLQQNRLGRGVGVTRHQLLVDDRVPYTSHNSSACIVIEPLEGISDADIMNCCRDFLLEIAAPGSDVGLCLADEQQAKKVTHFGEKAKVVLVTQDEARTEARTHGIPLEGLTGDFQGIIGALSAVGLHVHGDDGRYLWPRDIRNFSGQTVSLSQLKACQAVERVTLVNGEEIDNYRAQINLGEWPRVVRISSNAVLLVEKTDVQHAYKVLAKKDIKSVRP